MTVQLFMPTMQDTLSGKRMLLHSRHCRSSGNSIDSNGRLKSLAW
jgi:hypothetical protein